MNIFNVIVNFLKNSLVLLNNFFTKIVSIFPLIFEPVIKLADFLFGVIVNGVVSIIEFITNLINFFGGNL